MKLHTAYVTMETIEKQHASQSQTLLLLPPLRLPPSGLMASPQLGPSSISSWVKSVVAPSGLTRHEAGDGSCNREIRVVIGVLFIPSNLNRVKGFNTCHLVQRKNHDLYCSCVCCSSQHHTNAKTKLSNRAGLSFFYGTYCA